jgi:UDP-N-acetylglucosamine 2-epimerase
MKNRFRIEIYDEVKSNDLTIYSEQGVDKEYLTELVFSNIKNFDGNVRAFVYDSLKKKKTTALFLPIETIQFVKAMIPKKLNVSLY